LCDYGVWNLPRFDSETRVDYHSNRMVKVKNLSKIDVASRAVDKRNSRRLDAIRLKAGEDPEILQRENSIFPASFFFEARIANRKQSLGR